MTEGDLDHGGTAVDLLLLAVGPGARWRVRGPAHELVAAGALAGEVLAGRPVAEVAASREGLVGVLRRGGPQALRTLLATAAPAGWVREVEVRTWGGLGRRAGLEVLDAVRREAAAARLRHALTTGSPTSRDGALGGLAAAAALARTVVPLADAADRRALDDQLVRLQQAAGEDVWEVVLAYGRLRAWDGPRDATVLPGTWWAAGVGEAGGYGSYGSYGGADGGD